MTGASKGVVTLRPFEGKASWVRALSPKHYGLRFRGYGLNLHSLQFEGLID